MAKAPRSVGRPSAYTKRLGDQICTRLANGESLRSICRDTKMPSLSTVLLWVVNGKHPEFSEQYRVARGANGQAHGDRVADFVELLLAGEVDPPTAKVAIDALKWSAERMAPKQYGNRVLHAGDPESPVQVEQKITLDMSPEEASRVYQEMIKGK